MYQLECVALMACSTYLSVFISSSFPHLVRLWPLHGDDALPGAPEVGTKRFSK